jgi:lipopolysaccharide/colanic/teichoic acid biosynthesis glycosyltransferase
MLAKRILDIVGSGVLIILTLPIMALVAILVKLDSCGASVFVQIRVGANRRRATAFNGGGIALARERRKSDLGGMPFTMYKFRSMVQDAEEMLPSLVNLCSLREPVYKLDNDPRVTRFGRLLRQSSLDELPQLFNVLKGNMSLVGPRPETMKVVELYGEKHKKRLQVKPGLTGLQQVTCRGTISMQERLKYDLYYVKHRSMLLDLWILLKTFDVVIRGSGAR